MTRESSLLRRWSTVPKKPAATRWRAPLAPKSRAATAHRHLEAAYYFREPITTLSLSLHQISLFDSFASFFLMLLFFSLYSNVPCFFLDCSRYGWVRGSYMNCSSTPAPLPSWRPPSPVALVVRGCVVSPLILPLCFQGGLPTCLIARTATLFFSSHGPMGVPSSEVRRQHLPETFFLFVSCAFCVVLLGPRTWEPLTCKR